jgi:DNA-binding Lrp family transcriptional regulator
MDIEMISDQEITEILAQLGFSTSQAKLYIILAREGISTASTVAKKAQIDRAETYRTIARLQEKGFIKKTLAHPSKFQAIPINELIPTLVQMKKDDIAQIEKKSSEIIKSYLSRNKKIDENHEFMELAPQAKMIWEEIKKDIGIAKNHIDNITNLANLHQVGPDVKCCEPALKNGVKVTMILEKPCNGKTVTTYTMELTKYPNFVLRYVPYPLNVQLVIEDDKKLWLKTSDDNFYKSSWLVTNNRNLIALARDYFNKVKMDSSLFIES